MRTSQYLLATLREDPKDAELISHKLMLKAGMIRKLASGLYNWLPTGLRVLKKVEKIVREEMENSGAVECFMPAVQPSELWQESGRWHDFGPELLRFKDRHQREFCLGPTHEEIITDFMRYEVRSYKQLPITLFQVQNKFRDEIRPRFGVMRSREFLMKDAYSFGIDKASMESSYQSMYQAYTNIFTRLGLKFRAVIADTGAIGGSGSQEFHVLAESGEDAIAFSNASEYAANIEKAEALAPKQERGAATGRMEEIATPDVKSVRDVAQLLNANDKDILKTLIVEGSDDQGNPDGLVALVLRGDHELNEIKAGNLKRVFQPLSFASDEMINETLGCHPGSIGPVNLNIPIYVDRSAASSSNFYCGANKNGFHLKSVNWERDVECQQIVDIRNVIEGDPSPDGKGTLEIKRGIEVGHIFQLGTKYSETMNATVLDENGKSVPLAMGCYGIGISRVVAAAIEQNYDEKGIIWPESIAPFHLVMIPINLHRSQRVQQVCEKIYQQLTTLGLEVLFDDRKERPGVMFNDMELIGIPHRILISERGMDQNIIEYKSRLEDEAIEVEFDNIVDYLSEKLAHLMK